MKKLLYFIVFIVTWSSFSQETKPFDVLKLADSTLIGKKSDILILVQNEKFQVITSRKSFISTCEAWSDYISSDVLSKILKSKKINIEKLKKMNLEFPFEKIFENLLFKNECLVYNRGNKKLEKRVYVIQYEPNSENFGLEYKTENKLLILKTEVHTSF